MPTPDPARVGAEARAWYDQGVADGRKATDSAEDAVSPGWRSTEAWFVAVTLLFGFWAGAYAIIHQDVELERWLAITGAVFALAGYYTHQRTSAKKEAVAARREADGG